jgi:cysteine desulfurase
VRDGITLQPQLHGSGHERGLRSGTQDVLEIVGLGAAAERYEKRAAEITSEYLELRRHFEEELFAAVPEALLNGPRSKRLVNTCNFAFPGVRSGDLLEACPEVACAPGAACHKDHSTPSHVLSAMGLDPARIESSIRFSLGLGTTRDLLTAAVASLQRAYLQEKRVRT